MQHFEVLRVAVDSLMRHKTRALLTMLGIIIGVAAVVAMMAVGKGAQQAVETQIASLGTNILIIFPAATFMGGVSSGAGGYQTLEVADADAIRDQCSAVAHVTPTVRTNRQVVAGSLNWSTSIQGGNPDFLQIRDWTVAEGDMFTESDDRGATKVCVIGETVKENLFPDQDPVGQTFRVGKIPFKIIGTACPKRADRHGAGSGRFYSGPVLDRAEESHGN